MGKRTFQISKWLWSKIIVINWDLFIYLLFELTNFHSLVNLTWHFTSPIYNLLEVVGHSTIYLKIIISWSFNIHIMIRITNSTLADLRTADSIVSKFNAYHSKLKCLLLWPRLNLWYIHTGWSCTSGKMNHFCIKTRNSSNRITVDPIVSIYVVRMCDYCYIIVDQKLMKYLMINKVHPEPSVAIESNYTDKARSKSPFY
jgi:hypothetical protein